MSKRKGLITGAIVAVLVAIIAVIGVVLWNNSKDSDQATETTTSQQQAENTNESIAYDGVEGKTALELLKSNYQVEVQTYEGMGEFVTSINGEAADDTHFWAFYVNGEMATVGAGDYQTADGDTVEWKLDEIK